ncbi:hypothetical protein ID855_11220 [Xenorhabdus sp. ZM]|uniref:hypothetical protein n=1 Tax=Xenorhabdus szentirmaii TaxID=290112 RepID=UPI0019B08C9B|nr:hypothetical protein [Xenorhabdus sp. ZM]MBD2805250.1 hypothetical protein [Xenorhabdus sp. ZM]
MKRKLCLRNKRWLTKQCRLALLNDVPMDLFIKLPTQRAEMNNASRLKRRGKLLPDWNKIIYHYGYASLPFVGPRGKIYHYRMYLNKNDLPEIYQSNWLESRTIDSIDEIGGTDK